MSLGLGLVNKTVSVDYAKLCVFETNLDQASVGVELAQMAIDLHTDLATLLNVAAWLSHDFLSSKARVVESAAGAGAAVTTYTVAPELKETVLFAQKLMASVDEVANKKFLLVNGRLVESSLDSNVVKVFSKAAKQIKILKELWMPAFTKQLIACFLERIRVVSQTTSTLTPNWKFFIDDAKYNKALAKKHLLSEGIATLENQVAAHFNFISSLAGAFAVWGWSNLETHEMTKEDVAETMKLLDFATETCHVATAVRVLEDMPASARCKAASELLGDDSIVLPTSVRKLLQAAKRPASG